MGAQIRTSFCRAATTAMILLQIVALMIQSVQALSSPSTAFTSTKANIVAGATGYIGRAVVKESVRQGYQTIALVRNVEKVRTQTSPADFFNFYEGAQLVECDVTDADQLHEVRKVCEEGNKMC